MAGVTLQGQGTPASLQGSNRKQRSALIKKHEARLRFISAHARNSNIAAVYPEMQWMYCADCNSNKNYYKCVKCK